MIVDFAGFGTTTADALSAVRPGGRVIQVGLGRDEATISTADLVVKALTLRGARGGRPVDFRAVIDLIAKGDLSIHASTTTFEEIPEAIERLKGGDVIGRIVALMD
ncbi:MAG TPA: zinc-binding dehydrogenase, partial [Mycobacterium sp.]|nr:zinc-binding dehydrogenase [Mycobacterium sp.]